MRAADAAKRLAATATTVKEVEAEVPSPAGVKVGKDKTKGKKK